MKPQQFLDALKNSGSTVIETSRSGGRYRITSPDGIEHIYITSQAVVFGTWFNCTKCIDEKLPEL